VGTKNDRIICFNADTLQPRRIVELPLCSERTPHQVRSWEVGTPTAPGAAAAAAALGAELPANGWTKIAPIRSLQISNGQRRSGGQPRLAFPLEFIAAAWASVPWTSAHSSLGTSLTVLFLCRTVVCGGAVLAGSQ